MVEPELKCARPVELFHREAVPDVDLLWQPINGAQHDDATTLLNAH